MQQITHISSLKIPVIAVAVPEDATNIHLFTKTCRLGFGTETNIFALKKIQLPFELLTLLGEVLSDKSISFDIRDLIDTTGMSLNKPNLLEDIFISVLIKAGISFEELEEKQLKLIILKPN